MKKMKMCFPREKTFVDGFEEYILDCKARNLREGTINHYRESIKQIYKRIPPDTPISALNQRTMKEFYIALRDDPNLNEVSMGYLKLIFAGGRGTILLPNQLYIVEKKSRLGDTIPFLCLQSEFVKNTNSVSVGTRGSFPQSWFGD